MSTVQMDIKSQGRNIQGVLKEFLHQNMGGREFQVEQLKKKEEEGRQKKAWHED